MSLAELRQWDVGNTLLLKGLWLCVPIALRGGSIVLEHPAPAFQAERASIWRTNLILHMLHDGWLFRRHTFKQGKHGAAGPKPTTLLHANCCIGAVLDELAQPLMPEHMTTLFGKDESGQSKTSRAKEYPGNLCRCFALAIWRNNLSKHMRWKAARRTSQ